MKSRNLPLVTRRSSTGHLFTVIEPPMPRIKDAYLDCVIYLYPSEVDAEAGTKAGGCGFLVGVPTQSLKRNVWILYAVSNKHVVANSRVLRLNTKAGEKSTIETKMESWINHPDGDDISAAFVKISPSNYKVEYVPRAHFLSKEVISSFNIGPGDDCFMVGRFVNHEGRQKNLPTARFGNIAQMPWEKVRDEAGFDQESFLVEIRSISASSGSPIFVYIPIWSEREDVENWYVNPQVGNRNAGEEFQGFGSLKSHGPWLLGINWGYIHDRSPLRDKNGDPVNRDLDACPHVKLSTGIAAAVPAWKLAELLDTGPLADHRIELEKMLREEQDREPQSAVTKTEA